MALSANERSVTEVRVGQPVQLEALINLLGDGNVIDELAWNRSGTDEFVADPVSGRNGVPAERTVRYDQPGIYFPALRVTTRTAANGSSGHGGVEALGRARVIVQK